MSEIWAFSDIHGEGKIFHKLMSNIKPEDTIYFLGDAIDRAPDGWEILKELLNRPNTIYLKGNHEDMMVWSYKEMYQHKTNGPYHGAINIWVSNGGLDTYVNMNNDSNRQKIIAAVGALPYYTSLFNDNGNKIYLSHSGDFYFNCANPENMTEYDYLWDRSHYYSKKYYGEPDSLIIHGHTPNMYIAEDLNLPAPTGALWYCNNHKCDIDCGTHYTKKAALMNLNTFEQEIVTDNG